MIVLTDVQKQNILKYVEDKTYFNRLCFIIGVIVFIVCFIMSICSQNDAETFYEYFIGYLMGLIITVCTFKDVLKFRNTKNQLDIALSQFRRLNNYIEKQSEKTMLSKDQINSGRNRNSSNLTPMRQTISKYYLVDDYNNQYECISYLDYKKCIEKGEFIAVDFPTGEKFAFYE